MKYTLIIECDCGNVESVTLTRTKHENEGRIYEDYSSLSESFEGNVKFKIKPSSPDELLVICKECGNKHNLQS